MEKTRFASVFGRGGEDKHGKPDVISVVELRYNGETVDRVV